MVMSRTDMTEYTVKTHGLTKQFGTKIALNALDLQIEKGGIHALIGSNGAGKSTLFRILLGFETPTSGSSTLLDIDSQALTPEMRGKIGYVNEEHTLPNWMNAASLTKMQKKLYPLWNQNVYDNVIENFDVAPDQKIAGLSRGERAGLNLATALAQSPELLILDEPTLGLDVVAKQAFLEALLFIGTENESTIIYCSHQMEEIERVADSLIILERGEVKNQSTPDDFCERIQYWIANFYGKAPDINDIKAALSVKNIEGQTHIICLDQQIGYREYLASIGASDAVEVPINLDNAVNAFLAKNHKRSQSKLIVGA